MKIVVVDGQGGSLGKIIVGQLKKEIPDIEVYAIGTNSVATTAMRKAGATFCATGENPILLACEDADIIIGPMGIIAANSLLGEITPEMAYAIGKSHAEKILVPISKCRIYVTGIRELPYSDYVDLAIDEVKRLCGSA